MLLILKRWRCRKWTWVGHTLQKRNKIANVIATSRGRFLFLRWSGENMMMITTQICTIFTFLVQSR